MYQYIEQLDFSEYKIFSFINIMKFTVSNLWVQWAMNYNADYDTDNFILRKC